ncbi:MAG: hypothetical protein JKY22_01545 [Flavobacteriaceae bacterium]|nr:hypothetical protein [Flavobacteriaceae bacterium]
MRNIGLLFTVFLGLTACKNEVKEITAETEIITESPQENKLLTTYPAKVQTIFDAHGGVETWRKMNTLHFEIPKENGPEKHTVALGDRRSLIETNQWSIGYDGADVWLSQQEEGAYKGNAHFYHNVMFYFYAMPFVIADEGISYSPVEATILDGKSYDGIKISYNDGVGDTPKDEYIVYFDSDTNLMTWLAYTVTYGSNEKSNNWWYINYAEWTEINGLTLPKKMIWFEVKDGKPTVPRNSMDFENIKVSESVLDTSLFVKPDGATISE